MPGQEDESRDESAVGAGRLTEENSQNDNYYYNGGTHDSPLKIVLIDNSLQKHNFITHTHTHTHTHISVRHRTRKSAT